jgi:hypothetical protein
MSMLREFRDFAVKGNVVDLAVGVIIGAAFGKIVASLVEDIIMPLIGVLVGREDHLRQVHPDVLRLPDHRGVDLRRRAGDQPPAQEGGGEAAGRDAAAPGAAPRGDPGPAEEIGAGPIS